MINDKINKMPLPSIYKRNGADCYLDPYRNRLIQITPEETVRQKTAKFFEKALCVPCDMILLEQHMSHYGISGRDRADIVILRFDEQTEIGYPLAVVECKAPDISVVDNTLNQAVRYADALGCEYIFTTNGLDFTVHKYIEKNNEYIPLEKIPNYEEMLGGKYVPLKKKRLPKRTPIGKLNEKTILDEYAMDIGIDSANELRSICLNMWEGLLDVSHKLNPKAYNHFELLKDYGIRLSTYGNQSGSFSGPYRSFLIRDSKGDTQFVSLAFRAYTRQEKAGQPERTCLCVAIDNYEKSHHALQLSMDQNSEIKDDCITISHSGRITIGHKGSSSKMEFLSYVRDKCPELIGNNKIHIGSLSTLNLVSIDEPEYEAIIERLISYALIRDEYRLND